MVFITELKTAKQTLLVLKSFPFLHICSINFKRPKEQEIHISFVGMKTGIILGILVEQTTIYMQLSTHDLLMLSPFMIQLGTE